MVFKLQVVYSESTPVCFLLNFNSLSDEDWVLKVKLRTDALIGELICTNIWIEISVAIGETSSFCQRMFGRGVPSALALNCKNIVSSWFWMVGDKQPIFMVSPKDKTYKDFCNKDQPEQCRGVGEQPQEEGRGWSRGQCARQGCQSRMRQRGHLLRHQTLSNCKKG